MVLHQHLTYALPQITKANVRVQEHIVIIEEERDCDFHKI